MSDYNTKPLIYYQADVDAAEAQLKELESVGMGDSFTAAAIRVGIAISIMKDTMRAQWLDLVMMVLARLLEYRAFRWGVVVLAALYVLAMVASAVMR